MLGKEDIALFCGKCGSILRLESGKYSYYLRCSKHCGMHISLMAAENFRNRVQLLEMDDELKAGIIIKSGKYKAVIDTVDEDYVSLKVIKNDKNDV